MNSINSSTQTPTKGMERPAPQKEAQAETAKGRSESAKAETAKTKEADQQNAKATEQNTDAKDAKKQDEDPEISEYLKGISRLENKLKEDDITDEDLGKLMSKLEEKILSLTPQQKKVLKNMEFWMQGDIETVNEFTEYVADNLKSKDDQERSKAIGFLKDPQFIALIENKEEEEMKSQGYGPSLAKAAAGKAKEEAAKADGPAKEEPAEAKARPKGDAPAAAAAAAKPAPARPPGSGTSIKA